MTSVSASEGKFIYEPGIRLIYVFYLRSDGWGEWVKGGVEGILQSAMVRTVSEGEGPEFFVRQNLTCWNMQCVK